MFLNNKYYKWYLKICDNAKIRTINVEGEIHHIIPKSLGGLNNKENLVKLTYKEHFLCHKLLIKFTEHENKRKMLYAFGCMIMRKHKHKFSLRELCEMKQAYISASKSKKLSQETKEKISKSVSNKIIKDKNYKHKISLGWFKKGEIRIQDQKERVKKQEKTMLERYKVKNISCESNVKNKKALNQYGRKHKETSKKLSSEYKKLYLKNNKNPMENSLYRKKVSDARKGKIWVVSSEVGCKCVDKYILKSLSPMLWRLGRKWETSRKLIKYAN